MVDTLLGARGRGPDDLARGRRGGGALATRASCASGPGGAERPRGGRLERGGRRGRARRSRRRRVRSSSDDYPDALGRLWSALECPHAGDVLVSAEPGLRVRRLGRRRSRGRRQPRIAAPRRLQGVLLICGSTCPSASSGRSTDVTPTGARPLRCTLGRVTDEADAPGRASARTRSTCACARGCASRTTGVQLVKFCAVGGSGYVVNLTVFALLRGGRSTCTTWSRRRWPSSWR